MLRRPRSHAGMLKLLLAVLIVGSMSAPFSGHAQEGGITVGDTVEIVPSSQRINLRSAPGLQQQILTTLEQGIRMTVVGGPETVDGIVWWELDGEPGKGWAAASLLQVAQTASNETPVTAAAASVGRGTVDAYGFSGWCAKGWRMPDFNNPLPFNLDTIQTYQNVTEAMSQLQPLGYTVRTHENDTAEAAYNRLAEATVFFSYSHGTSTGLLFHDDQCNYTKLALVKPVTAPDLRLAVLLGCETGQNLNDPNNILRKFQNAGARKAIGMGQVVPKRVADHWNKLFWEYAVQEGMEVGDAARKAANDNTFDYWFFGPPPVVILGNEDVYVHPKSESVLDTVDLSGSPQEFLQRQWNDLRQKIEQQITVWLQELEKSIQAGIERAIRQAIGDALRQLCGASAGIIVLVGTVAWGYRQRERHPTVRRRGGCIQTLGVILLVGLIAMAAWWLWRSSQDRPAAEVSPELQTMMRQPNVRVRAAGESATPYGTLLRYTANTQADGEVHFDVDKSGAVVGFFREGQRSNPVVLSLAQARSKAVEFGREHFPDPALLETQPQVAQLVTTQDEARYYRFVWFKRDEAAGAFLPQSLQIEVNAQSGRVDSYNRLYELTSVDTRPSVTQDTAEATVLSALTPYLDSIRATETTLVVTRPVWKEGGGDQQLIWYIHVTGAPDEETGVTPGGFVAVDALTGTIADIEPTW